jgi:hypothetical protein
MSWYPQTCKVTTEQNIKRRTGLEVLLYSFINLGARWWCIVNATPLQLSPLDIDPVPISRDRYQGILLKFFV